MIPYGRQDITAEDIAAVTEVLRSDFLTQGPAVPRFERAVADRVRVDHALAMNSATSALHVACLALDLGPGDVLWTTPSTFVASANCARYCGADVDFVDIDPATWNISLPALRSKLEAARRTGRLPKVLVSVHLTGQPPQQAEIWDLAREYDFRVLEDASHAIGAQRHGEPVGSCRWSDIAVFSFHPVKIITAGEGGMALTNDENLARNMAMLRSHGITRDPAVFRDAAVAADPPAWYYEQQMLGYNYRMTDIHAALGLSQLGRIDDYVARRIALAQRYDRAFAGTGLRLPTLLDGNVSAWHLYVIRLAETADAAQHRRVFDGLRQRGIGANLHYYPVHLQPYYRQLGFREGDFPEAEAYGRSAITLPLYPSMSVEQQDEVIVAVRELV